MSTEAQKRARRRITYAVRFDDGTIDLFGARQLFTEWGEEKE